MVPQLTYYNLILHLILLIFTVNFSCFPHFSSCLTCCLPVVAHRPVRLRLRPPPASAACPGRRYASSAASSGLGSSSSCCCGAWRAAEPATLRRLLLRARSTRTVGTAPCTGPLCQAATRKPAHSHKHSSRAARFPSFPRSRLPGSRCLWLERGR